MSDNWLQPVVLENAIARLEPLGLRHHDALVSAVRDGELWKLWYTYVPTPQGMRSEIEKRLERQALARTIHEGTSRGRRE